jgi:alpha-ketoglutarate-dependent taurine dioxygenase
MSINAKQLAPLGAEIVDFDLSYLLEVESGPVELLDLLEANGFLLFSRINFDEAQLLAFAHRLGQVVVKDKTGWLKEFPGIYVSTLDPKVNDAPFFKATFGFHIDGTVMENPYKATLLEARVVAKEGGETQFASSYDAYERLSDEEKAHIEDLEVLQSLENAVRLFNPDPDPEDLERLRREADPPRVQPLVWKNRKGRKSLGLSTTSECIEGMPREEGRALIKDLIERATAPEFVYTHRWTAGDLVVWDNRGAFHRAIPYSKAAGRVMHRVGLAGDEPLR